MELSIILPSIREGWLKKSQDAIFRNTYNVEYEVLVNKKVGVLYDIINQEFLRARGEWVVLLCDDFVVEPNWARRMIDFLKTQPENTIGDFTLICRKGDISGVSNPIEYYGKRTAIVPCVRKKEVEDNFGYLIDPRFKRFYGDNDLSLRFWAMGGSVVNCPEAKITVYRNRDTIKRSALQQYLDSDRIEFHKKWDNYDFILCANTQEAGAL